MLYINVYEVDRAYGGPEEGGWWFTTQDPQLSVKLEFLGDNVTEDDYYSWTIGTAHESPISFYQMQTIQEHENFLESVWPNRHMSGNVRYRGGDYIVLIEEHPAIFTPETIPHYE